MPATPSVHPKDRGRNQEELVSRADAPLCGISCSVSCHSSLSRMPASSHGRIRPEVGRPVRHICSGNSWSTEWKKLRISASSTQFTLRHDHLCRDSRGWCEFRPAKSRTRSRGSRPRRWRSGAPFAFRSKYREPAAAIAPGVAILSCLVRLCPLRIIASEFIPPDLNGGVVPRCSVGGELTGSPFLPQGCVRLISLQSARPQESQ
jgi:hypothetical protein